MAVTVVWDDASQTIQRYIYASLWTWAEVFDALEEGHRQLDDVQHPVDAIVDMSATTFIPSGAMSNLKRVFSVGGAHPNYSGFTVFLNAAGYVKAMHEMVREVYPESAHNIEFLFANSDEEAYQILYTLRPNR